MAPFILRPSGPEERWSPTQGQKEAKVDTPHGGQTASLGLLTNYTACSRFCTVKLPHLDLPLLVCKMGPLRTPCLCKFPRNKCEEPGREGASRRRSYSTTLSWECTLFPEPGMA